MTPADMLTRVATHRGLTLKEFHRRERVQRLTRARFEAMWILREATELSYPQIGALFHGMDHTSVIHGVRVIAALVLAQPAYGAELLGLVMAADPDLRRLDRERETPEPVPVLKGQGKLFE